MYKIRESYIAMLCIRYGTLICNKYIRVSKNPRNYIKKSQESDIPYNNIFSYKKM